MVKSNFALSRGFTLIESMIALVILTTTVTVITVMILQTQALSFAAARKSNATALAQQGIEQVRGIYQQYGFGALTSAAGYCYKSGSDLNASNRLPDCNSQILITDTIYSRRISIMLNTNQITAKSYIFWTEKGENKSEEITTHYYGY